MPNASAGNVITSTNQIVDGIIQNSDINASAAIAYSKLALALSIVNGDISGSAAIAYSKLNLALGIVNGDISASAAIAISKLESKTQGQILYFGASGVPSVLSPGTSGQFLKTNGAAADPTWAAATPIVKAGIYQYAGNAASGDLVIAHGLGKTPTYVRISASMSASAGPSTSGSIGTYDGTNTNGIFWSTSITLQDGVITSDILYITDTTAGNRQEATISIDGTNITLHFTKTGSGTSNTIVILWEAQ